MARLRVGVIGAGRIAVGSHLPCLARFGDVELVLCDTAPERLAEASSQFGIAATETDYRRLLATARLDAAFVLTPPPTLFPIARDCLAAGVPTLLEKPPGLATAETRALAATARRAGVFGMVGLNRRFQPLLNRAKELVEAGGPIATVIVEFYHFHMDILREMGATEEGLAQVLTTGCIHSIDLMRYLCGEVTEVYAHAGQYFDRHPDSFTALVRFAGGATALFHNHLLGEVRAEKLTIHGRRASAYLEGLTQRCVVHQGAFTHEIQAIEHADPSAPQWADRPRQPYLNGWWDQDRHFLDCVRAGRPPSRPAADLDDAARTMALIDHIREQVRGPVPAA
ncbi:MAG TPA: Gfo/Idh/MocA family oxidoreductase [Thermomicrobiales bacterium]|nr:Gfo/Idh/MocA family oxidoreductase [Thermomicrobiales bacterium]